MKTHIIILLFLVFLSALAFAQKGSGKFYNPFSGTFTLTIEGGPTMELSDYSGIGIDYFGKAGLEYFFNAYSKSNLGLRLFGGAGFLSGKDDSQPVMKYRTKFSYIGAGIVYILELSPNVFPYLFAGASHLWFDPRGENDVLLPNNLAGLYKKREINYNGELGFRFLLTDNLSFNLNAAVQISPNDRLDDITAGTSNDMFLTAGAGFTFSFFSEMDSDGDGIVDSKDNCPNTPKGLIVDESGCPIDSDKDGVSDYLDRCPGTPRDVKVNSDGCPQNSDGDNVPDYLDLCPDTPGGIPVDEFGCPYDLDADGVPDYLDRCSGTPYNVQVDQNGCPVDSDKDGVPDHLDLCPDTPPGANVDSDGCEIIEEEPAIDQEVIKEVTLSSSTSFGFNSATLLPGAFAELDKLVAIMKEQPVSRWRIEGHTDNVGSDASNKKLSLMRAESVLNYFLSKGISKNRFEVVGLGKEFPVADNKTEEGRSKNRRVRILKIN
jgi:outer membrane protein OmpA-like peptidoglycan-associated protein